MYHPFVGSQLMTQDQADDHLAEMASAFESGSAAYAVLVFVASGGVPQAVSVPD